MGSTLRRPRHDGRGRHRATLTGAQRFLRALFVLGAVIILAIPAVSYARAAGVISYTGFSTGDTGVVGVVKQGPDVPLPAPVPLTDDPTVVPSAPASAPSSAQLTESATPTAGAPPARLIPPADIGMTGSASIEETPDGATGVETARPTPVAEPGSVAPTATASPRSAPQRTVTVTVTPANSADLGCAIENPSKKDVHLYVRVVACFLDDEFDGVTALYGRRPVGLTQDHPDGVAVDIMVDSVATGDQVSECARAHFNDWHIAYIIWQQAIVQTPGGEPIPMADRGNDTANHRNHVHLSFDRNPNNETPKKLEC